ncbi:hypothetical protein GWI33_018116 [Rhynchophorus ferrugineus]|uniref:Uncharacterized protein n=1 Tax=Rhynchophorus ferrugineus TaxID=354439 RepID=A0A834M1T4_RHYFE|nr:hypothetical protein GWI33_018116 [Rhynchophorus ferrugineus]
MSPASPPLAHLLAPGRVRVLVPLVAVGVEGLLCKRHAAPAPLLPAAASALEASLRLPLVLVTPVKLPFTCYKKNDALALRTDLNGDIHVSTKNRHTNSSTGTWN